MTDIQDRTSDGKYKGVEISSRYELAREVTTMEKIVDALGPAAVALESIWCDSKMGMMYIVELAAGRSFHDLEDVLAEAVYSTGGHNGVAVRSAGKDVGFINPDWPGDRIDMEKLDAQEEVEKERLNQVTSQHLPEGFLDRLRASIPLSQVVGRWVQWDARKSNQAKGDLWGPCPFHSETTSSFHVDDRKGFYYCFGCHAKGDALTMIKEKEGLTYIQAVRRLAFITGLDHELQPPAFEPPTILQLKEIIVKNFSKENFLEVGVLTEWGQYIRSHDRLLRSLSWGDPDYAGNVLELLTAMEARGDGSIAKLQSYIATTFSEQAHNVTQTAIFSAAKSVLGYQYTTPRNDIIGVMMPFQSPFKPVYEAIQRACGQTPLPAKRADEVWNNSTVISDILELINHSAVVICDLTGRNENVFYELGIAHAWGKTVIPITQSAADVPFDLRHHRYLQYLNNGEGLAAMERDLASRLTGLVGEGKASLF